MAAFTDGHLPADPWAENRHHQAVLIFNADQVELSPDEVFVADSAGTAVIGFTSVALNESYLLRVVRTHADLASARVLFDIPLYRWRLELEKGQAATADGPMTVYDDAFDFLGRTEAGSWYAPADGSYHVISQDVPTLDSARLRPEQVIWVNFDGGLVGAVPELGVDLGTLSALEAGLFGEFDPATVRGLVMAKLAAKFAPLAVSFVSSQPESLPFSTLFVTGSTPVSEVGLAMRDGLDADQFDDAYIFAENILNGAHGLAGYAGLTQPERLEVISTAIANVAAAEAGRIIGALPVADPGDLMALEDWAELGVELNFSNTPQPVAGRAILQRTVDVLSSALSSYTEGAFIETDPNNTPDNATQLQFESGVASPTAMGQMGQGDVDFYRFTLAEEARLTFMLNGDPSVIHLQVLDSDYAVVLDDVDRDGRLEAVLGAGTYYVLLTEESALAGPMALEGGQGNDYALQLRLAGDATGDAMVDVSDFQRLADHWGQVGATMAEGDLNGDGVVNFGDFQLLQNQWHRTVAPAPEPLAESMGEPDEPVDLLAAATVEQSTATEPQERTSQSVEPAAMTAATIDPIEPVDVLAEGSQAGRAAAIVDAAEGFHSAGGLDEDEPIVDALSLPELETAIADDLLADIL